MREWIEVSQLTFFFLLSVDCLSASSLFDGCFDDELSRLLSLLSSRLKETEVDFRVLGELSSSPCERGRSGFGGTNSAPSDSRMSASEYVVFLDAPTREGSRISMPESWQDCFIKRPLWFSLCSFSTSTFKQQCKTKRWKQKRKQQKRLYN